MFSWYKYLIVGLVFSRLGFWSGNLFLNAPFPDLCLLVPFFSENLGKAKTAEKAETLPNTQISEGSKTLTNIQPDVNQETGELAHQKNQQFGFSARSSTYWPVQPREEARSLKFQNQRNFTIHVAKTKTMISCAVTAQLVSTFVITYADCLFSHDTAQYENICCLQHFI